MKPGYPALEILGIALAAFAVWFAVRLVNRRKKLGKKFWVGVARLRRSEC